MLRKIDFTRFSAVVVNFNFMLLLLLLLLLLLFIIIMLTTLEWCGGVVYTL